MKAKRTIISSLALLAASGLWASTAPDTITGISNAQRVIVAENAGAGITVAGRIANRVLQAAPTVD